MLEVFSRTRHTTCIPPAVGGSGNPSEPTARGVVCAMEAAIDFLAMGTLEGKAIAMQGAGNVSGFMIRELLARGVARIVASEISKERIAALEDTRPFAKATCRISRMAASGSGKKFSARRELTLSNPPGRIGSCPTPAFTKEVREPT